MDNENITYNDKTIILEEDKIICGSDIENEINYCRTELYTYNIDELFCSCGHICICSKCLSNIEKIDKTSCVICKVKSEHIRVI